MSRIVLFGGGGFVGGNLATVALRQGWQVHVADALSERRIQGAELHTLDVTDQGAVRALISEILPDAAVYLAAVADIDKAERERELAWAVNVEAARTVASACAASGATLSYMSSDAVFPGTALRYAEEDPVGAVNHYGRTKAEGEKAVLAEHPRATVVRVSLVLGFPVTSGNAFLAGLRAKLEGGQEVLCPTDEIRTPVDVFTLSACLLELAEGRSPGIIHIGSTDSIDRFTLTREAAVSMGYPHARIGAQEATAIPAGRAPRHKRGVISVAKAQRMLSTPLLTVEQSIRRAINDRP